jgi:hypothetical protein
LFLDTDITLLHAYVATELAASPYSDEQLLHILRTEAGPTFATNLFSVAGEWVGWNAEEARGLVTAYVHSPSWLRLLRRLMTSRVVEHAINDHWQFIRPHRSPQ